MTRTIVPDRSVFLGQVIRFRLDDGTEHEGRVFAVMALVPGPVQVVSQTEWEGGRPRRFSVRADQVLLGDRPNPYY